MNVVLECVVPGLDEPLLRITNPPVIPNVGDIMPGDGDIIYRIVQRAFIVEKQRTLTITGGNTGNGSIIVQCAILPVTNGSDE